MKREPNRDEWQRDLYARQRNIVFPDTVENEARLWRNLGENPLTTLQKIGYGLFGIFVFGTAFFILSAVTNGKSLHDRIVSGLAFWLPVLIVGVLIFGPIMDARIQTRQRDHHGSAWRANEDQAGQARPYRPEYHHGIHTLCQ